MDRVTGGVGYCEDLVFRSRDQVSFLVPVTTCHFLAVLRDAWNLSLVLPVEEDNAALIGANGEHRLGDGPGDVSRFLFLVRHFNILKLPLAHRVDRNRARRLPCHSSYLNLSNPSSARIQSQLKLKIALTVRIASESLSLSQASSSIFGACLLGISISTLPYLIVHIKISWF